MHSLPRGGPPPATQAHLRNRSSSGCGPTATPEAVNKHTHIHTHTQTFGCLWGLPGRVPAGLALRCKRPDGATRRGDPMAPTCGETREHQMLEILGMRSLSNEAIRGDLVHSLVLGMISLSIEAIRGDPVHSMARGGPPLASLAHLRNRSSSGCGPTATPEVVDKYAHTHRHTHTQTFGRLARDTTGRTDGPTKTFGRAGLVRRLRGGLAVLGPSLSWAQGACTEATPTGTPAARKTQGYSCVCLLRTTACHALVGGFEIGD